ncbi:MAG: hypothetical protein HYR91_11860 [Flavobacteriia bacterium]|nr:hypothetical protein [Flavobacteriia bacterium]
MRKLFSICFFSLILIACQENKKSDTKSLEKIADLQSELEQIKFDSQQKEALITESLHFFDEVQSNLEMIDLKRKEIKIKSDNEKLTEDDKKWILEEIKHINYLRQSNANNVKLLSKKLTSSNVKIKELESMIERLALDIQTKDEQIAALEIELKDLNVDYIKLFDAYQEQAVMVDELEDELNRVYYTYGTEKELKENQVIEKKNGFIGIGKKVNLIDGFNEKYFTEINRESKKEILIEGLKLEFITDHPSSSYKLLPVGNSTKLIIENPADFWKVSKYLVIIVK